MKKYVLVAMLGAFGMGATAQSSSRFTLGPNAGVGSTWIDNIENKQFKTHGNFGLSLVYSATPHFGIGTDVKYSFEGAENEVITGNFKTKRELNLDYLRIPVKAIYFFGERGNRLRPKLSAGPTFGYLMGGKTTTEISQTNGNVLQTTVKSSKDGINRFDIGLNGAAGFHYRIIPGAWLTADVAYYHGLRDISDNTNPATPTSFKNRNVGLNFGVNFGL